MWVTDRHRAGCEHHGLKTFSSSVLSCSFCLFSSCCEAQDTSVQPITCIMWPLNKGSHWKSDEFLTIVRWSHFSYAFISSTEGAANITGLCKASAPCLCWIMSRHLACGPFSISLWAAAWGHLRNKHLCSCSVFVCNIYLITQLLPAGQQMQNC